MTMEERMAKGYLWGDTDEYLEEQARAKDLMYEFNQSKPSEVEKRNALVKEMFGKVEEPVWVQQPITLARGKTVSIGSGTYINSGLTLIDDYKITIGSKCLFGTNVTLCTTGHPIHPELREQGGMYSFPIVIGDGAWIGAGVVILPGITIGENAVIGAGSVVTKDIPANVIAVGNPCKVLREITDKDKEYYYHDMRVDAQE
ncbi:MAG: DapH/DapD/GlmU-related protein [Lachnospiraceae bacterium]|nr:DapH/DapD/GlmU-related protein [Lachnospiraceae bacterium]